MPSRLLNSQQMGPKSKDGKTFIALRSLFGDTGGNVAIIVLHSDKPPVGGVNDYVIEGDGPGIYYLRARSGDISGEHSEGVLEIILPGSFPKCQILKVYSEREPCRKKTAEDCDTKLYRVLMKYGSQGDHTPVRWFVEYASMSDGLTLSEVTIQHNEARAFLKELYG